MPVPFSVPADPGMRATVGRQREDLGSRERMGWLHIDETDLPPRILFCHRSNQPMHARMSWVHRLIGMDRLGLCGDHGPTQCLLAIPQAQQRLDQPEQLQHAVLLVLDDRVLQQGGRSLFGGQPYEVIDRLRRQLFTNDVRPSSRRNLQLIGRRIVLPQRGLTPRRTPDNDHALG